MNYVKLCLANKTTKLGECFNIDVNKTGSNGYGCNGYETSDCGQHDDEDFKSNELCCICGGGEFGNNESMPLVEFAFKSKTN